MDVLESCDIDNLDEYEKPIHECFSCGWFGTDPFEQRSSLWENGVVNLCPDCGEML